MSARSEGWTHELRTRLRFFAWRRYALLMIGGSIVTVLLACAIFPETIATHSPYAVDVPNKLQGPTAAHWLGTDELGRDTFSRTVHATTISIKVALIAVAIGLVGGTIIGTLSAFFGGLADMVTMRAMDLLYAFPAILLAIVIMAALGTSILNAMLAIGIVFIPGFSRLARALTLSVVHQGYIEAAHVIGMSQTRIVVREILPNVITPLVVEAAVASAYAILIESSLSFLGLGAQPPEASWGNMLDNGRGFMGQTPWLGIVPGMAMFLAVLGFTLLGDGLRDFMDPKLKD